MEFLTTQQAAELWGISDRRVRTLCAEGRIKGASKEGRSYKIPADAQRPTDKRVGSSRNIKRAKASAYLKWDSEVIGILDEEDSVAFIDPNYNAVVTLYTHGKAFWSPEEFASFLAERVVSRDRRDIERILFRLGMSAYDVVQIAYITRGMHPKDLLWIARTEDETLDSAMTSVFDSVFRQHKDLVGKSIDSPEGYNIKRYGVHKGRYGIFKQRISPLSTDVESEVAVFLLAKRLGVACCPAYRADKDTVFSEFLYDFSEEYIVHFRSLFEGARSSDEYRNLVELRPELKDDISKMVLLDFITRQDDRHLSNIAIKVKGENESFYPLYDNGRSLFYEDTEELVSQAIKNPVLYATSFGYEGSYWDHAQVIAQEYGDFNKLIDLNISKDEVATILGSAGFIGYRFEGALEWILQALAMLKSL